MVALGIKSFNLENALSNSPDSAFGANKKMIEKSLSQQLSIQHQLARLEKIPTSHKCLCLYFHQT